MQGFIDDLVETMRDADGAGLAAIQVYEPIRICAIEVRNNPRYPYKPPIPLTVLVNPVLTPVDDELFDNYEGCLSVPNLRGLVQRNVHVRSRPGIVTARRSTDGGAWVGSGDVTSTSATTSTARSLSDRADPSTSPTGKSSTGTTSRRSSNDRVPWSRASGPDDGTGGSALQPAARFAGATVPATTGVLASRHPLATMRRPGRQLRSAAR